MKAPILFLLMIAYVDTSVALTLEEYGGKTAKEKVAILRGKPDRVLDNPSHLLRLYATGLRDTSLDVQRAAAQSSVFLMMGLQSGKPAGELPSFTDEDSADFQQALVAVLEHPDESVRSAAANALAYSSPPIEAIEDILLTRAANEPNQEVKGGLFRAMGQAGYQSDRFVVAVLALMQSGVDSAGVANAASVLSHIKPVASIDKLISLATTDSPIQRYALTALGGYGQKGVRAKPALERLLLDQSVPEDMRNLARITLGAITSGNPQPSNLQPIRMRKLWPVVLTSGSPPPEHSATKSESKLHAEAPSAKSSGKLVDPSPVLAPPVEVRSAVWPWFAGVAVMFVLVGLFLKRRA